MRSSDKFCDVLFHCESDACVCRATVCGATCSEVKSNSPDADANMLKSRHWAWNGISSSSPHGSGDGPAGQIRDATVACCTDECEVAAADQPACRGLSCRENIKSMSNASKTLGLRTSITGRTYELMSRFSSSGGSNNVSGRAIELRYGQFADVIYDVYSLPKRNRTSFLTP